MEWTADVTAGDWIRERVDPDGPAWHTTMHSVVPRGFPAYARVFHPATRDRPVGEPWPPLPYARHAREWEEFQSRGAQIDAEAVTWAATASAFGRRMHPLAQWHRLAADPRQPEGEDGPRDAAGWRYGQPAAGTLDAEVLAGVVSIAARHTTTPHDARAAVWEGHGGLVGALGYGPSRVLLTGDGDQRHDDFLAHSARDAFNDVFRKPTWQPGILSDEISRGARLQLPNRAYVLFHAGLKELADPGWVTRVPWADAELPGWTPSPGLLWPADRAWVLVSEVDWDSTIIGGEPELIRALCSDPAIETLPLDEGADLTEDADEVNR
ncbi:hypothetical protein ACTU3I_02305 [Microbacterium sp. RD1]|uniref:hypothetical protein n=1 Tax=Microbacterium sp. RD1 TaxID=3457313 RepID=UPI003FA5BFDE